MDNQSINQVLVWLLIIFEVSMVGRTKKTELSDMSAEADE